MAKWTIHLHAVHAPLSIFGMQSVSDATGGGVATLEPFDFQYVLSPISSTQRGPRWIIFGDLSGPSNPKTIVTTGTTSTVVYLLQEGYEAQVTLTSSHFTLQAWNKGKPSYCVQVINTIQA